MTKYLYVVLKYLLDISWYVINTLKYRETEWEKKLKIVPVEK